jgi:hypothetical protein
VGIVWDSWVESWKLKVARPFFLTTASALWSPMSGWSADFQIKSVMRCFVHRLQMQPFVRTQALFMSLTVVKTQCEEFVPLFSDWEEVEESLPLRRTMAFNHHMKTCLWHSKHSLSSRKLSGLRRNNLINIVCCPPDCAGAEHHKWTVVMPVDIRVSPWSLVFDPLASQDRSWCSYR